ncbi:MAG: glycosyltransferase family 4 protein [Pseudomonadota bacterium]
MHDMTLLTSEFDPFRGGIGTVSRELALAATRLGVNLRLVAPDYLGTDHREIDATLPFPVERFKAGPYSGRQLPKIARVALAYAKQSRGTRLVAIDYPFLETLALTSRLHRAPFDAILHGSEVRRAAKFPRQLLASRIFKTPQRLIANSDFTKRALIAHHPSVPEESVTVAPLGVTQRWFEPSHVADIRQKLHLGDKRIIVCTGRITRRKGQLSLVRALEKLASPDSFAVVIVGKAMPADAEYLAAIETEAKRCPVDVFMRSDLDDDSLRALYAEADLFCLPGSAETTAIEGFGLVFLEAAAQGLPAVAGNVGGVPEAVKDDVSGVLVAPDNVEALSAELNRVLGDDALLKCLSAGALQHAKASTWERFAKIALNLS